MTTISLPSILRSPRTVQLFLGSLPMEAGGSTGPRTRRAVARMEGQEQTNWCWSAVTQAVKDWASAPARQEDIATQHIQASGRTTTCSPPRSTLYNQSECASDTSSCLAECNDPHILSVILRENGRFMGFISQGAWPDFQEIVNRIDLGKPVPCRVQWNPDGGHFILVVGYTYDANGQKIVHVLDPASKAGGQTVVEKTWPYDDFVRRYSLSSAVGEINFSYEVQ